MSTPISPGRRRTRRPDTVIDLDAPPPADAQAAADVRLAEEIETDAQTEAMVQELRAKHRRFVFPWTAVFFVYYMALMVLAGFAPGIFGAKVFGAINFGYIFALSQFAMTFLIAWLYSRYAARALDPLAGRLRERAHEQALAHRSGR